MSGLDAMKALLDSMSDDQKNQLVNLVSSQQVAPMDGEDVADVPVTPPTAAYPPPPYATPTPTPPNVPTVTSNYSPFTVMDREALIRDVVDDYIEKNRHMLILPCLLANASKICYSIRDDIMNSFKTYRDMMNSNVKKGGGSTITDYQAFPAFIVAKLLINTGEVKKLSTAYSTDKGGAILIVRHYYRNASTNWMYKWSGQWKIVDKDATDLMNIFHAMCPTSKEGNAFLERLKLEAPTAHMRRTNSLTFWRNGVYDMEQKRFMAYDDPSYEQCYGDYITLRKNVTNHPLGKPWGNVKTCEIDPQTGEAIEPTIVEPDGNVWHAMDGLQIPFEMDTDVGQASFKIICQGAQFMLRGCNGQLYHFWINQGGSGSSGKGMLADAFSRLVERKPNEIGEGDEDVIQSHAIMTFPIEALSKDYNLNTNVLQACANFGNETNTTVGYIEDNALIKLLSRNEEITVRPIYEPPFQVLLDYIWWVQMSNNLPRTREKNGSIIECIVAIPFEKILDRTNKKYIKSDYIRREEVASYYAWYLTCKCPMWDIYDPQALAVLKPFKQEMLKNSMTTFQFFEEFLPICPLDVIPVEFLYDIYLRYCEINGIEKSRQAQDKNQMATDMEQFIKMTDMNITFSKKRGMVMKSKDYDQVTGVLECLERWSSSPKLRTSKYVKQDQWGRSENKLNWGMLYDRQWNCGCFVRTVSHFDDPTFKNISDPERKSRVATDTDIENWVENASADALKECVKKYLKQYGIPA